MKRIIISILFLLVSQLSKAQICTKSQLPLNLQNGLVGFYPFCGNANDGSGNGVNGVVNGATLTADRFGVANSAYRFNGTDNFITMANAPSNTFTSSFSISVWVKPSAGYGSGSSPNGNQNQVVSKWGFGGPNNAAYALGVDQTGAAFTGVHDGSNNSSAYSTPITVSINDWHHLVSTLSGGVLKLYINNVLVNTTFNSVNPQSSNYALEIAREAIGNYAYFKGDIDDIQLYNRALSHCEISQIYTSTTSTFTTPDILTYNSLPAQNSFCGSSLTLDAGAGFTNYLWNTGATSQTITATSSGEYRVTVTNASGCTASDTINVSLVKADILQSDQIACLNNPVTLSINSYATQSAKTIDFDNIGLAALDVSGGSAGTVAGVTGNGLSITRPTEVKTKDQTYGYGDYEVDAKTGDSFSNQYLSVLLPSNSWTNEGISIDSRPDGTDDVGWGVHVNAGLVASASGTHPASASNWYKMKIRVTPDSVKCWINNTLLYEGLNTSVPRNSGAVKLTSFSTSYFDNLKYTPYQTYSSVLWSTSATTSAISVTPTSTTTYFATISDGIASCTDSVKITINNIVGFNPLQDTVKVCGDSLVLDAGAGFTTYNWSNGASTRTITAKNSGKYVVTVTNANGCSASDTSYLSIVKAKIIQPDTTICKGSSLTLSIDSSSLNLSIYNSLNFASQANFDICSLGGFSTIASGVGLFGGIPFTILPCNGLNTWNSSISGGANPRKLKLLVNNQTVETLELLSNTYWGQPGPVAYNNVSFWSGGVKIYNKDLIGNVDTRDFLQNSWTNSINNTTTINVKNFTTTSPISRLDKIKIALPAVNYVDSIIVTDIGDNLFHRLFVYGATVKTKKHTILWSNGDTTTSISVSPTTTTKYFVTVSNGITTCKDSITVTVSDIGSFNPLQDTVKVCGDSLVLDAGEGYATYNWSNGASTRKITAKNSGKYFVSVTNANGCSASDTSYVSIIKAKILQSDTAICKGSSISLSIDSSFKGSSICDISQLPNSLRAGLVAFYPFCGDLIDKYSGVAAVNHGSTLVLDRFNNPNSAINFNGSSWLEGVSSNLPIGQAARTVCFWYKESSAATASGNNVLAWGPNILANRFDVSFNHQVAGMSTGAAFSAKTLQLNSGVQISKWNFYSAVVPVMVNPKVADVKLYQNGILLSNVLYSTGINTVLNTIASTPLVIGKNTDLSLPYYLNGQVDDIYIYNRALSATEISSLYTIQPSVNWSTGSTANIITVSPTTKTKYFVTVTDGITTCTDSIVVDISSSELKLTDPAAVCSPAVVDLTAAAVTAGSASGLTFTYWRDANATQALINPDKVSVSGTYFIVGRTATGCTSAPTAVKVTVNPLPVASIVTPTQTTICDNSSLTLTATGGTTYQWLLNGAVIAGATSSTYAASLAGSYEVNVIALGCTSKVAAPVNLSLIKVSVPKFSNSSTCIDVPVSFFNETDTTSSGSVSWLWDFGDGQTSNLFNPVYTYKNSGAFIVKLTVTPKLCSSLPASITKNITVDIPPIGIKYPNVLAVKNKARSLSARFIANGYTYLWMPSTGLNNSAIQKPEFNFSQEQLYRIRLTSAGGCITMDSVKVSVYDSSDIFVPKAFSPNKDGKNDLLQPFLVNITILKFFRIYNRWGQLMFQSSDSKQGWDGMYNYKPQPLETYTWIAEGIDGNGTTIFRKGQTILIR